MLTASAPDGSQRWPRVAPTEPCDGQVRLSNGQAWGLGSGSSGATGRQAPAGRAHRRESRPSRSTPDSPVHLGHCPCPRGVDAPLREVKGSPARRGCPRDLGGTPPAGWRLWSGAESRQLSTAATASDSLGHDDDSDGQHRYDDHQERARQPQTTSGPTSTRRATTSPRNRRSGVRPPSPSDAARRTCWRATSIRSGPRSFRGTRRQFGSGTRRCCPTSRSSSGGPVCSTPLRTRYASRR